MKLVFRESLFSSQSANHTGMFKMGIFMLILLALYLALQVHPALADSTTLPGVDASSQMESAGTLLRFIDTGIFKWGARLLAGLCIFGAAWSLKEGRYGPAVISVISAILFGTAPTWVRDIFTVGGSDSVFTSIERPVHDSVVGRLDAEVIRHV